MRLQNGAAKLAWVPLTLGLVDLSQDVAGELELGCRRLVSASPVFLNCALVVSLLSVEGSCFTLVSMGKDNYIYLPG